MNDMQFKIAIIFMEIMEDVISEEHWDIMEELRKRVMYALGDIN